MIGGTVRNFDNATSQAKIKVQNMRIMFWASDDVVVSQASLSNFSSNRAISLYCGYFFGGASDLKVRMVLERNITLRSS